MSKAKHYFQTKLVCGHQIRVCARTLREKIGNGKRRVRCDECWANPEPADGPGTTIAQREALFLEENPPTVTPGMMRNQRRKQGHQWWNMTEAQRRAWRLRNEAQQ